MTPSHPRRAGWLRCTDLAADANRNQQIIDDVLDALGRGRHCLILTQRTGHLEALDRMLHDRGHDPEVLRGAMGAKARTAALDRLNHHTLTTPLLVVATGLNRPGMSGDLLV